MKYFTRGIAAFAMIGVLLSATACSTNSTTGKTTFNTAEFASDAQAVAYAANIIANLDVVKAHIGTNDQKNIATIIGDINTITAQAAANSNGTITIDTGKTWVTSLAGELQNLLAIAAPIVKQYDSTVASYLDTVSEMIPLVETLVGAVTVNTALEATAPTEADAPEIRAKIYSGFTPTVSLTPAEILRGEIYNGAGKVSMRPAK